MSQSILIVCQAGVGIGLGHLARALALGKALLKCQQIKPHLLLQAEPLSKQGLDQIPHSYVSRDANLTSSIHQQIEATGSSAVVFDLHPNHIPAGLDLLLKILGEKKILRVGIDSLMPFAGSANLLDLLCLPGFYIPDAILAQCKPVPVLSGWDYYLIDPPLKTKPEHPPIPEYGDIRRKRLLVLTGGSDVSGLSQTLPGRLDGVLPMEIEVLWVQGPYSKPPVLPESPRLLWSLCIAPESLATLMASVDYALTIYGVSLFELFAHGVPTLVFSPYGTRDTAELLELAKANIAWIAKDEEDAIEMLLDLLNNPVETARLAQQGLRHVDAKGAERLANAILKRIAHFGCLV